MPILKNILSKPHYLHFCILVRAVHILSCASIKESDLLIAETCLQNFVQLFSTLYSPQYVTMNAHQLLHITDCVRATGPLFSNNCFVFEDLNGYILGHIHGTQGIDTQVINTINLVQAIPILSEMYLTDEDIQDFYKDLTSKCQQHSGAPLIETGILRLGRSMQKILSDLESEVIGKQFALTSKTVVSYSRVFIVKSASYVYARVIQKNDATKSKCCQICH